MKKPLVSIIIVSFEAVLDLKKCLKSIFQQNYENFEVIVIDNASKDKSVEMVKKLFVKVKIIQNKKNLGYAAACDMAAKIARGEFLAILNQDIIVQKNWLAKILPYFAKDKKLAVCQPKNSPQGKKSSQFNWDKNSFFRF